jgi:hypothetical protein
MNAYSFMIAVLLALFTGQTLGEADGPDFYKVRDVSADDTLNIRAEPRPDAARLGEIPPDANCISNLGCQGGLTFQEFTTLTKEQHARRIKENPCWCRIEYRGITGWVAGRYLAEDICQ